jgi:uncharacterized protein (TIGR03086 family)
VNLVQLHRRSCEAFGDLVHRVGPDRWTAATPCSEWDVRALVNHLVGEDLWTPPLLAGKTLAEVGDAFDGDVLGSDPVAAYDEAARAATAAVAADGVLDRIVHLSFGDVQAAEYVGQLFADHLVHAWDLARALGVEPRLDPELVAVAVEWFGPREELYRSAGAIGARPELPAGAGDQERLLAAFGRAAAPAPVSAR